MKRNRILPLGTPEEPRQPDRLEPLAPRERSVHGCIVIPAVAVMSWAAVAGVVTGCWPW